MMSEVERSNRSGGLDTAKGASMRWAWLLAALCFILLPLIYAIAMAMRMTGGGVSVWEWLPGAMRNRGFVKYTIIAMVLSAALFVVCVALWRIGARGRRRARSQDGGAMVEFALVLPFAVALVLLLAQASFLMVGHLCVQYSAYCAARTAIVAIPDDLMQFSGEPQNFVALEFNDSIKQNRIHRSAAWAVMPVSCSVAEQQAASMPELVEGLDEFFTAYQKPVPGWVKANLQRKWQYAMDHTFVDLDPPISGDLYGEAEDVHVSVRHTFYLSVPVARTIFAALDEDAVELDIGTGEYGLIMRASCVLTNEGVQDYVDEETFPKDR